MRAVLPSLARFRKEPRLGYSFGAAAFVVALVARFAVGPYLPPTGYPFLSFFPAVALTTYVAGLGPGLFVSLASTLSAWFLFFPGSQSERTSADLLALGFFVGVLLVDCVVIHVMITALDRLRVEEGRTRALSHELALRLDELHHAKEATDEASRAKSRLMATLGHDLKQPLNVVALAVELLVPERGGGDPSKRSLAERAQKNLQSLGRSLDLLVEAARLDASELRPNVQALDLGAIFAQLADEIAPLAAEREQELRIGRAPYVVRSDRNMLLSILRNFASNAIKYTPRGGSVRLDATPRGAVVHIVVADDGPGIPSDKLEVVFREFERLAPADAAAPDGLGLGLALVERTAGLLGHELIVESELGRGSRFGVCVPRIEPAEEDAVVPSSLVHAATV